MHTDIYTPVLNIINAHKSYNRETILKGVNFSVHKGEILGLMGPSGSGKSTLLNCIAGLQRLDDGDICYQGKMHSKRNETDFAEMRRRSLTSVFQFFHLLPTLSVKENIELPLLLLKRDKSERETIVHELLDSIQLSHRCMAFPETLSGGEMQRVALARALVIRPDLILADEPTGSLDSKSSESILILMKQLTKKFNATLIIVTHDKETAEHCDRLIHLKDGKLSASPH